MDVHTDVSGPCVTLVRGLEIEGDRLAGAVRQEAEVLGTVLAFPEARTDVCDLKPEDFVVEEHSRAFRAVLEIGAGATPRAVHERSGVPLRLLLELAAAPVSLIVLPDLIANLRTASTLRATKAAMAAITAKGVSASPRELAGLLRRAADQVELIVDNGTQFDAAGLTDRLVKHIDDLRSGTKPVGVTTGFRALDAKTGGWRPGELVIVAGRPGMGKTVFLVASARAAAEAGDATIGIVSLEVGAEQFSARVVSDQIRAMTGRALPYSLILRDAFAIEEDAVVTDALARINGFALNLSFADEIDLSGIETMIDGWRRRAALQGKPLKVVFIDYLKFIRASDRYRGNRTLEIGETTRGLRQIAKRQGVCVVLLTQINRAVETRDDKRPNLSDLRDSGEIEQDADLVLMLYRESYYLAKSARADDIVRSEEIAYQLEILIEKNRAGETGTLKLWCDVSTSSIRDA